MKDDWLHGPTIERCAQVADKYSKSYGIGAHIAAEIMALKDKP